MVSPERKHGGGRPRSSESVRYFAEQHGISVRAASRLRALNLSGDALLLEVAASKRCRDIQLGIVQSSRTRRSMRALGMQSRVPGRMRDQAQSLAPEFTAFVAARFGSRQ